ncbi:hypothetical protein BKA80DRAFT_256544 [Phyllosticta citrichinensis]
MVERSEGQWPEKVDLTCWTTIVTFRARWLPSMPVESHAPRAEFPLILTQLTFRKLRVELRWPQWLQDFGEAGRRRHLMLHMYGQDAPVWALLGHVVRADVAWGRREYGVLHAAAVAPRLSAPYHQLRYLRSMIASLSSILSSPWTSGLEKPNTGARWTVARNAN